MENVFPPASATVVPIPTAESETVKLKRFVLGFVEEPLDEERREDEGSDDDEQKAEKEREREEFDRKKAEKIARRRKWRGKKCLLLSIYIMALLVGLGCLARSLIMMDDFDDPPSDYAQDSKKSTIYAFVSLMLISPFGFIILSFRISNMFVGMVFMFCIILVVSFGMKGLSRAVYSIRYDKSFGTMRLYFNEHHKNHTVLLPFYAHLQGKCQCCGFREMDRLKDWPTILKDIDFPDSCCRDYNIKTHKASNGTCGIDSKLARMKDAPVRIASGFLIIRTENEMNDWSSLSHDSLKDVVPKQIFHVAKMQEQVTYTHPSNEIYNGYAKQIFETNKNFNKYRAFITGDQKLTYPNVPSTLLILLDTFAEEMIYGSTYSDTVKEHYHISRGEWIYFELPLNDTNSLKANSGNDKNYRLYYASRGLVESIMLENVLWPKICERGVNEDSKLGFNIKCKYLKKKSAKEYYNYFGDDRSTDTGIGEFDLSNFHNWSRQAAEKEGPNPSTFFKKALNHIMKWNSGLCSAVIIVVFLLALIFWYFYSRMKAEEQADLALPTDFDLLHLDLPSFNDLDEAAKALEEEILRLRMKEQHARILKEEQQRHARHEAEVQKRRLDEQERHRRILDNRKVAPEELRWGVPDPTDKTEIDGISIHSGSSSNSFRGEDDEIKPVKSVVVPQVPALNLLEAQNLPRLTAPGPPKTLPNLPLLATTALNQEGQAPVKPRPPGPPQPQP